MSLFLVFEGLDGSGKSTLIEGVNQKLVDFGASVFVTREPGGPMVSEKIRDVILTKSAEDEPTSRCELLLYAASRAQHVEKWIEPALKEGKTVLCDRFTASSVAFQQHARGLSGEAISWLNNFATDGIQPRIQFLLDLTVEESARRRGARGQEDRIESEKSDFHERVRQGYLKQAEDDPSGWVVLDATKSPETLIAEAWSHISKLLEEHQ